MIIILLKDKNMKMNITIRIMISICLIIKVNLYKNIMILIKTIINNYIINFKPKKFKIIIIYKKTMRYIKIKTMHSVFLII
jgi:hypothetical protein